MMLCDFHVHSTFSDGRLTIAQLVDLYGSLGFGAIAITDHLCEERSFLGATAHLFERTLTRKTFPHYVEVLRREAERAHKTYGMLVIPGYELTKNSLINQRSAHVVVLGLCEYVSADAPITELLKHVTDRGGLSIAAHPVSTGQFEPQTYYLWSRREQLRHLFDAWEVASGARLFPEVLNSGLPMIANSDLHHPHQINSWKTRLFCRPETKAVFEAIRRQEVEFVFYRRPELAMLPTA